MKGFKISVTQEMIDEGVAKISSTCMIAQALRHIGARSVHVTAESVSFNIGDMRHTAPLPPLAAAQLMLFDGTKKQRDSVQPFTFNLHGRTIFQRPIEKRPGAGPRGPNTGRSKASDKAKWGNRRFHGLRVIELPATA